VAGRSKRIVATDAAPAAIGTYSQAVEAAGLLFISGQIPLDPATMELVGDGIEEQADQVFRNLAAIATARGGCLDDLVKLTVYLLDLDDFGTINEVMARHVSQPYPARAAIGVSALPRGSRVEIEAIMALPDAQGPAAS
jgi:reactive intermediate/imine deaminase